MICLSVAHTKITASLVMFSFLPPALPPSLPRTTGDKNPRFTSRSTIVLTSRAEGAQARESTSHRAISFPAITP